MQADKDLQSKATKMVRESCNNDKVNSKINYSSYKRCGATASLLLRRSTNRAEEWADSRRVPHELLSG